MNTKTIRELASEAGLDCEPYVADSHYPDKRCLSIVTGDPVNSILALIDVVVDNVGNTDSAEDALSVLGELTSTLRSPKQRNVDMNIILYWPKLNWEE